MTRPRAGITVGTFFMVGAIGCVTPLFPGSERVIPPHDVMPARRGSTGTKPDSASSVKSAFTPKLVSGKESPSTLVARDGSRCTVSAKRYDETKEGEESWCAWTSGR